MQDYDLATIDIILFDLGGVVVEVGAEPFPADWAANPEEFIQRRSEVFALIHAFETGAFGAGEFADRLISDFRMQVEAERIIAAFRAWPKGLYPWVETVLPRLGKNFRLAVLSNSNEIHWPRLLGEFDLGRYFEAMFSSHQIGAAKPDAESFRYALEKLKITPERVLFIDDKKENTEAARRLGLQTLYITIPGTLPETLKTIPELSP